MFLVLGFMWAGLHAFERIDDRLPEKLEGQNLLVEGMVSGLPQQDERMVRFEFEPDQSVNSGDYQLPPKIRISWYSPKAEIKAGQRWRMMVRLKRPHGTMNPIATKSYNIQCNHTRYKTNSYSVTILV